MKIKLRLLITAMFCMAVCMAFAESVTKTYTFTSKTWKAVDERGYEANWISGQDGYSFSTSQGTEGVQVSKSVNGANTTSPISFNGVTQIVITYSANATASSGNGVITTTVGNITSKVEVKDAPIANHTTTFQYNNTPQDGEVKITVNIKNGSIYIKSISITYDGDLENYVAAPVITPPGGTYTTATEVEISCDTDGADIYYTTDGTTPTENSNLYDSYIYVDKTTTIKSIAIKDGECSAVATATFTIIPDDTRQDAIIFFDKENCIVEKNATDFTFPTLVWPNGYDGTILYSSSNEDVAIIDKETGKVTIKDVGTTIITASAEETEIFSASEASYTLNVYELKDGVFDFTAGYDYGSGKSNTSTNTNIDESDKIWTSGNVVLKTSGRILWHSGKQLRLFVKLTGQQAKDAICELSVPDGLIKEINIEGEKYERLIVAADDNKGKVLGGNVWTGSAHKVTLAHDNNQGVITITKLTVTYIPKVEIGEAQYITYCNSEYALDFSSVKGLTAYVVSDVGENTVTLREIEAAPAETPVILHAEKGTYALNIVESAGDVGTNYLKVSDGKVQGGDNIYALAKIDGNSVGFRMVDSSVIIPVGKCYLDTNELNANGFAPSYLGFSFGEVDAIEDVETSNNVSQEVYYNLNGQRVQHPSNGIYILNNKKVLIK